MNGLFDEETIRNLNNQIFKWEKEIENCKKDIGKVENLINQINDVESETNKVFDSLKSKIIKVKNAEKGNFGAFFENNVNGILNNNQVRSALDICTDQKIKLKNMILDLENEIKDYDNRINHNKELIQNCKSILSEENKNMKEYL